MDQAALRRLARFSSSIRDSTLKRLRSVPQGKENWKRNDTTMSFADIAQHLIDADQAYMAALDTESLGKNLGRSGCRIVKDRDEYDQVIRELERLKKVRHDFIVSLDDNKLNRKITCDRIAGIIEQDFGTVLLLLLDHEIQQRGILIVHLKIEDGC